VLFCGSAALAETSADQSYSYGNVCSGTNIQICGMQISIPQGNVGFFYTYTLPKRFQAQELIFQCISEWKNAPYYKLNGDPKTMCDLKTCRSGTVSVCGVEVDIKAEISIGKTTKLDFPKGYLATNIENPPDIYAECKLVDNSGRYEIKDEYKVSCNVFACRPTKLEACNSSIVIPNSANLGAVLQLQTVDHRPVTVQCLSTNAQAPLYTAVDCTGVMER
jgi:hypothetical protein